MYKLQYLRQSDYIEGDDLKNNFIVYIDLTHISLLKKTNFYYIIEERYVEYGIVNLNNGQKYCVNEQEFNDLCRVLKCGTFAKKDKNIPISNVDSRFLNEPLSHSILVLLGYTQHTLGYYCPPLPADCATYRLEYKATQFQGSEPINGTEEWRAFLPFSDEPTIRRFKTLGELRDFHKGMCGGILF